MATAKGKVSITTNVYVNDKLFKVGCVFDYFGEETQLIGCGCGGKKKEEKKFFILIENNITYLIPQEKAVVLPEYNQECKPDFEKARRDRFEQADYTPINNNCLNCNQQDFKDDPNNN